jgi:hypothetical protein
MNKKLLFLIGLCAVSYQFGFMMPLHKALSAPELLCVKEHTKFIRVNSDAFRRDFLNNTVPLEYRKTLSYNSLAQSTSAIIFDKNGNTKFHQAIDAYFFKDTLKRTSKRSDAGTVFHNNTHLKNIRNKQGETPLFYAIKKYVTQPHLVTLIIVFVNRFGCVFGDERELLMAVDVVVSHKEELKECGIYEFFIEFLLNRTADEGLILRLQDELNCLYGIDQESSDESID